MCRIVGLRHDFRLTLIHARMWADIAKVATQSDIRHKLVSKLSPNSSCIHVGRARAKKEEVVFMPSKPGGNGGKRAGAGRKAGSDWHSKRPPAIRTVARANVLELLQNHQDPLLGLLEIAENRDLDPDVRVKAYIGAMPFVRPRLSMSVSADVTPDKVEKVDKAQLLERMLEQLDRLQASKPAKVTVEASSEPED